MRDQANVEELSCRRCGKTGWKSFWSVRGHEGRCKGIPGLLERVSKIQSGGSPVTPSSQAGLGAPQQGAQAPPSPAYTPATVPLPELSGAQLLEARISRLEEENSVLKEIVTNDLQHLQAQDPPNPLPWIVLGGAVLLGGFWLFGAFDQPDDHGRAEGQALGDARPRASSTGSMIAGKLLDKVAGKVIDRAINRLI